MVVGLWGGCGLGVGGLVVVSCCGDISRCRFCPLSEIFIFNVFRSVITFFNQSSEGCKDARYHKEWIYEIKEEKADKYRLARERLSASTELENNKMREMRVLEDKLNILKTQ